MSNLPPHEIHAKTGINQFDVFIAGSGPIGATYARLLTRHGYNVIMTEIGDQETRVPASHKKNEIEYQKDIDRFVRVIQGALSTVSVPPASTVIPQLDPSAWRPEDPSQMTLLNGRNPNQQTYDNLPAESVTRCVGGMSTHWTCATPEFFKENGERPKIFPGDETLDDDEWKLLYEAARNLIGVSSTEFDQSIRHNTVLHTLQKAFPNRGIKPLPLACHRLAKGSPYVRWHAADNVYYDLFDQSLFGKVNSEGIARGKFFLLTNTRCTKLHTSNPNATKDVNVGVAEVMDLLADRFTGSDQHKQVSFAINAKVYVVAAGAVATPQILANSDFGGLEGQQGKALLPALGVGITEQPLAFCQIILNQHIVDDLKNLNGRPQWWKDAVEAHRRAHPKDPLWIPFQDPEPQVNIPVTKDFPWHAQIHRDAFSYGEAGPRADSRVVVDLRFFARQAREPKNKLTFDKKITDVYGMPQPTFKYLPTTQYADEAGKMMKDMTEVASALGGYLPGSEPQFMAPGLALHLGGTVRLGHGSEINESVANFNSQVWNFKNLYVAGNGTIPTAFAANPTLTSIALALRATHHIVKVLKADPNNLKPAVPEEKLEATPKEYLKWLTDPTNPDFPDHHDLQKEHKEVIVKAEPSHT
uniref:Pyranose 2-oxidase n=1 Tax=Irpex lacteus TaxID=5319 RepID=A0A0P0HFV3_IRPLA|nr:hypothetical protein [Irpex lacteus]